MEKETIVVELKDKRKITVSELTGLDEMIASKVTGVEMNTPGSGMLQYRQILLAFSIVAIDDKPTERPTDINKVRAFLAGFKMKDTSKLQKAFSQLNDADKEDSEGEVQATE